MLQEMFLALLRYFNISRRVLRILLGFAGLLVQDICTLCLLTPILAIMPQGSHVQAKRMPEHAKIQVA